MLNIFRKKPTIDVTRENNSIVEIKNFRVDTKKELEKLACKQIQFKDKEENKTSLQRSMSLPNKRRIKRVEQPLSLLWQATDMDFKENQVKQRLIHDEEYIKETRRLAYKQLQRQWSLTKDERKINEVKFQNKTSSPKIPAKNVEQQRKIIQQMGTYMNWINSQLDKRDDQTKRVADLSKDMRDGVIFLQLVEVIGKEKQKIYKGEHISSAEMLKNIDAVLEFLSKNNVRVHHIVPKDIVGGNVKATMRLVLALAAHFKPDSFQYNVINSPANQSGGSRQSTRENVRHKKLMKAPSITSLASDAAASLIDASKNASSADSMSLHYRYRNGGHFNTSTPASKKVSSRQQRSLSLSNPNDSMHPKLVHRPSYPQDLYTSCPKPHVEIDIPFENQNDDIELKTTKVVESHNVRRCLELPKQISPERKILDAKEKEYHDEMVNDLNETKNMLLQLQNMLGNEEIDESLLLNELQHHEDINNVNIELLQTKQICTELQSQLCEMKELTKRLTAEKTGYETRISQQEQQILSFKSKLLEYEVNNNNLNDLELQALLEEKNKELYMIHDELSKNMKMIEKQKHEINSLSNDVVTKSRTEANLHSKLEACESLVSNLQNEVKELTEHMHQMTLTPSYQSDENNSVRNKINEANYVKDQQRSKTIHLEQSNIYMTLTNIKQQFSSDDPIHHAFQSVEQSITSLVHNMSYKESTDVRQSTPNTVNVRSSCSTDSGYDHNANVTLEHSSEPIKVIYYLGKSITPVLKMSEIGIGYLTLRDFKTLVNRPGKYRYFFKSIDKDFGCVREELLFDDDLIPGHEHKVVAWIEKDMEEV